MTLDWIEVDNEHSKLLGSTKNKSCSACKVDPTLAFDHAVLIKRYELAFIIKHAKHQHAKHQHVL
jgi:hypothetical protein